MTDPEEIDSSLFCRKINRLYDDGEFDGWDLDVEFYGTRIYKRFDDVSSLFEYRVVGNLRNVRPEVCYGVYTDLVYRKKWDQYACDVYKFEEDGDEAIYWQTKFFFPIPNRDYTYRCKTYELDENDKHVFIVHAYSFDSKIIPPKPNVKRVSDYKEVVVITSDDVGGTIWQGMRVDPKSERNTRLNCGNDWVWWDAENGGGIVYMEYVENPKDKNPDWLVNWAANNGIPDFLTVCERACLGYERYLELKN